jgi:peptidoglycan lytic transglycosylase G
MRTSWLWITLFAAATVLGAAVWASYYLWFEPTPVFALPRMVSVKRGESFRSLARKLKAAGVVRSATVLLLYADFSGAARHVRPGDYAFDGGERIPDVMRHLVAGNFVVVTVTIPEGSTVHDIAERLEQAGLACPREFEDAARRGALVRALGLGTLGAEGYLFPATYRFPPHATTHDILGAMLERFFCVLKPAVVKRAFELGLSPGELVTLASIIEKEAKVPGERRLIASVFYNRIRLGMPLQSDPTAKYSLQTENEPAAEAVRTPSAFNTYMFAGLPPGPIANPGLGSIEAALHPAHTDYLYFVARDDGTHIFSRSLGEQRRAIAMLRKLTAGAPERRTRSATARRRN